MRRRRRRTRLARLSERESNLDLVVMQFGDRRGRHQRAAADVARLPVGKPPGLVIALDVAPIGPHKATEPLAARRDADLVHQLHSETRGLELVRMQHLHEAIAVLRVLQIGELVLQRWSDPLNGVAEQMEQQEALHLEGDVGIDDDSKTVEDARLGRLEIAVFDHESMFDDARTCASPEIDELVDRPLADLPRAVKLVTADGVHGASGRDAPIVPYFCGIGTSLSHARTATFGASPEINGLRESAAGTLAASD